MNWTCTIQDFATSRYWSRFSIQCWRSSCSFTASAWHFGPFSASCWRCGQMCLRHAAMSSVIIPPGCRFMPANQRNRQNFQKLCKSLLTVTKNERPLALWNLWDLRAVARCLQWKTFGADIGHQMPLAWVMQSCSVCSRKVFGCRWSDSFPENVLLASRLPVSNFLIFQFMRALMIGNVTQMLWLLARHLNEQPLRGFYVHHWDENIANSKSVLFVIFDQFFGDSRHY